MAYIFADHFASHIVVIRYLVWECFASDIRALWHYQACLTCHNLKWACSPINRLLVDGIVGTIDISLQIGLIDS